MSLAVKDLRGSLDRLGYDFAVLARDWAAVAENEQKLGIARTPAWQQRFDRVSSFNGKLNILTKLTYRGRTRSCTESWPRIWSRRIPPHLGKRAVGMARVDKNTMRSRKDILAAKSNVIPSHRRHHMLQCPGT